MKILRKQSKIEIDSMNRVCTNCNHVKVLTNFHARELVMPKTLLDKS